jgi:hypothetical protein
MSAYATGQRFFFVAPATNTGACTLNINAIGAKSVTKQGTTALAAGDIVLNGIVQVVYDGTQFQILNPVTSAATTVTSFSAGTTGLTPSTTTTGAVTLAGTLAIANGGTNNASLPVTAGGVLYTDGSKVVNSGAITSGYAMLGGGTGAPTGVAPSTSGNLLTSNGSAWTSAAPPATGGLTLLGTLTMTGSSISLTSLVLTSYKQIQFQVNAVTGTVAGNQLLINSNAFSPASASAKNGFTLIDLTTGAFTSMVGVGTPFTTGIYYNASGLTTASTSITITAGSGTWTGGSILVYGVK